MQTLAFSACDLPKGLSPGGAWEFVEKRFGAVILSAAKNLLVRQINHLRDSSSPAAPQNDMLVELFNKCLGTRPFSSPGNRRPQSG